MIPERDMVDNMPLGCQCELRVDDADVHNDLSLGHTHQTGVQTAILDVPVTVERPPYNPGPEEDKTLPNAGTGHANKAASTCAPEGTPGWAESHSRQTVLQQHCEFFDTDRDGVVWPADTYRGFYVLGFGVVLSLLAMVIIHANFSYPTCPTWVPDPFFRVFLDRIHKAKHGSDTGTFDHEGRFVSQKFEDFFSKYSKGQDGLTFHDVLDGLNGQRVIMDPIGWFTSFFEWSVTWLLLWPEDGVMKKEDVRRVFDGSIFSDIASKRARAAFKKAA